MIQSNPERPERQQHLCTWKFEGYAFWRRRGLLLRYIVRLINWQQEDNECVWKVLTVTSCSHEHYFTMAHVNNFAYRRYDTNDRDTSQQTEFKNSECRDFSLHLPVYCVIQHKNSLRERRRWTPATSVLVRFKLATVFILHRLNFILYSGRCLATFRKNMLPQFSTRLHGVITHKSTTVDQRSRNSSQKSQLYLYVQ